MEHFTPDTMPIAEDMQMSTLEHLKIQREMFIGSLLAKQMVTPELAESGMLDSFAIDEPTEYDALRHVLIGDQNGGLHHLPTVMQLDSLEYEAGAASKLTGSSVKGPRLFRRQGVHENGTFRPKMVTIGGQEKTDGSVMFPNEWSTEKVVRSVLAVSDSTPIAHDQRRASYVHEGDIDGVKIRVVTSDKTAKIITAFPEMGKE